MHGKQYCRQRNMGDNGTASALWKRMTPARTKYHYITRKTGRTAGHRSQQKLFHALKAVLDDIRWGADMRRPEWKDLERG